jgi:hypothetical protein
VGKTWRDQRFEVHLCPRPQGSEVVESQSHIVADGQSAGLSWCRAPFWDSWPDVKSRSDRYSVSRRVASSLTRGRVCHLLYVEVFVKSVHIYIWYSENIYTQYIDYKQYIHGLCQSRQCAADYALSYHTLCYNGSSVTWTVVGLYFLCWASPCPILRTFGLWWFWMTSACCLHNFVIKS